MLDFLYDLWRFLQPATFRVFQQKLASLLSCNASIRSSPWLHKVLWCLQIKHAVTFNAICKYVQHCHSKPCTVDNVDCNHNSADNGDGFLKHCYSPPDPTVTSLPFSPSLLSRDESQAVFLRKLGKSTVLREF